MKILTFIIPAYNSEAFLDKCISSMLAPEALDKLEIIVVNDGSVDATADIAEKYRTQFPDVIQLLSQKNKGHGGALNTGCAAARGKYLKVIDADDWVETQNLPEFLRFLEECSSDVVLTHYRTIDIGTGEIRNWCNYPETFGRPYSFDEIMSNWRSFDQSLTFHGITYQTDFFRKHAKPLPEHVFYEDHEYATFPCCWADTVTCFNLTIYDYRIGDVHQSVSNQNQLKRMTHTETVVCRMLEMYQALPENNGKCYAAMKTQGLILSYLTTALLLNPNRAEGRRQAHNLMSHCQTQSPDIYHLAQWKYKVFCILNYLHIKKSLWDAVLDSKLYIWMRGKHTDNA